MVALREEWFEEPQREQVPAPEAEGDRWLSLRHASCCLDVCTSTLRRRIRRGDLPWRVVDHGRRWSYEVLVPDGVSPCAGHGAGVSTEAHLRRRMEEGEREIARLKCEVHRQEERIENLSQALVRARAGNPYRMEDSPFSKYRELALRRRRWWFF